ncbi:helix-turn-helix transcriptional regulator [Kribbella sandramycini]|uniref:AraC-like DNA-binding protein n=1 Tax=Kribbella sandramycini TaxID=60450 RepID=A0A7Y4NYM5_9ACTN|nr:AraC family transcriptional regulator [Kribbella sandramycini]MBB6567394.1 AraC-like DNA-binding protein [Kribbella sandramycini]NOL39993.1 helix-turn-helix transcriptional regulator [Kribbella sandramycini]
MHKILTSEVFPDARLPVAEELIELSADVAPHSHAFFEIAIVVAGAGVHVSADGARPLEVGEVVVLRPGQWHGYSECSGLVVRNAYLGADVFGLLSGATSRTAQHPAVQHAMRLLEADLTAGWTLGRLAAAVNLAPGSLVRLFGRTAGVPPMAFLNRLRAERAAGLLIETELPIGSIGALVGWPDPSHATRRFRAHFGLSPTRYREAFRP